MITLTTLFILVVGVLLWFGIEQYRHKKHAH